MCVCCRRELFSKSRKKLLDAQLGHSRFSRDFFALAYVFCLSFSSSAEEGFVTRRRVKPEPTKCMKDKSGGPPFFFYFLFSFFSLWVLKLCDCCQWNNTHSLLVTFLEWLENFFSRCFQEQPDRSREPIEIIIIIIINITNEVLPSLSLMSYTTPPLKREREEKR